MVLTFLLDQMAGLDPLANRIPHHDDLVEKQTPDPTTMVSMERLLPWFPRLTPTSGL